MNLFVNLWWSNLFIVILDSCELLKIVNNVVRIKYMGPIYALIHMLFEKWDQKLQYFQYNA